MAPAEKKEAPPAAVVVPQTPTPVAPPAESPALIELLGMGFSDVNVLTELLKKYNGDIEQVVAELVGA